MKRIGVWLVVALALAGAGWWYFARSAAETATVVPATVTVERGTVEKTVLASGVIEAATLVSVGAEVSGQIETLAVAVGDEVARGDLIAEIASREQQNAVLQAEADLQQIEAQIAAKNASITEAELAVSRTAQLNDKNLASTQSREAAEATLAVARAELKALQAQMSRAEIDVASARLDLERTRITAPVSGTVVAIVTAEGQTVNAAQSSPTIVKIADLDNMVVKAEISEADVVRVAPGQEVTFTLLGEPDVVYAATLRQVNPAPASIETEDEVATDTAIYYQGLFDVANPERKLRIGMTAEVTIVLDRAEDVLTLLSSALGPRERDGTYRVEVWHDATASREERVVEVGLDNNITAEISAGLTEGETVVADRTSGTSAAVSIRRRGLPGF